MKKILFISHDATTTGAPIVLLNFLEWLNKEGRYELCIFLKHGGDLENKFQNIAPTYAPVIKTRLQRLFGKIKLKLNPKVEQFEMPLPLLKQSFDLIYINTVVCLDLVPYLKDKFNCPVICHVHENDFTIKYFYPEFVKKSNLDVVDHFIAVSRNTLDNLVTEYQINSEKISLVYGFIPIKTITEPTVSTELVKNELNISDEFIVGGCGLTTWRKGIDLFVQLALKLDKLRSDNNIKLIWVGNISHEFISQFNYETKRLNIPDKIIFTGKKVDPQNYFQLFDVFALTSREDPFPLVALEAAALNKPILCFNDAGGMPEIIENRKNGIIVPYADVKQMAEQIIQLMDDNALKTEMGKNAGKLVQNFDVAIAGKQIVKVIEQLIN